MADLQQLSGEWEYCYDRFPVGSGYRCGPYSCALSGVEVGTVESISLTKDLRTIQVKVSIKSDLSDALREGTQFWLVTPKASLAGVSGLDALVGGNYIGMMPGPGKEKIISLPSILSLNSA